MSQYLKKGISTSTEGVITDVDPKTGTIKGYFSIFGNVDSDKDMIMPGAFTKTLAENGSRIRHVWQHDITMPLAKPTLIQDSKGLAFESNISQTTWGKNALILYNDRVIDEHSIGYNTIRSQAKSGYSELTELRLWEGSSVTLGANELAIGGSAKSWSTADVIEKMSRTYKAIRHGKYEGDDVFFMLDAHFEQLKQLLFDKLSATPAVEETPEPKEEKSQDNGQVTDKINSLIALFK